MFCVQTDGTSQWCLWALWKKERGSFVDSTMSSHLWKPTSSYSVWYTLFSASVKFGLRVWKWKAFSSCRLGIRDRARAILLNSQNNRAADHIKTQFLLKTPKRKDVSWATLNWTKPAGNIMNLSGLGPFPLCCVFWSVQHWKASVNAEWTRTFYQTELKLIIFSFGPNQKDQTVPPPPRLILMFKVSANTKY